MTLTASNFKAHVVMKDNQSKGDRAKFLYGSYTFDCSLPNNWVQETSNKLNIPIYDVTCNFIWLYLGNDSNGQPAPLNLKGCDMLERLEAIQ